MLYCIDHELFKNSNDTRFARQDCDVSKWVQPASVASLIAWLASDAGKDVNGAVIPV